MAIRRDNLPADAFTIVPNAWLRDPKISAKAKGILCYIASHAAGYVLTVEQMLREMTDAETAIRSGLKELEEAGYLARERQRSEGGRLGPYEWSIGIPAGQDQTTFSSLEDSTLDDPSVDNVVTKKTTDKKTTKEKPSASPRGTRLPEDWKPDPALIAWYQAMILGGEAWSEASRAACRAEHERFADHWRAAAGQNARKLDWAAAWRNWMRRAFEGRPPAAPTSGGPAGPRPPAGPQSFRRQDAADRERDDLIVQAMDMILNADPQMKAADARRHVLGLIDAGELDLNRLKTSAPTGYIDVEVIDTGAKEVTGS